MGGWSFSLFSAARLWMLAKDPANPSSIFFCVAQSFGQWKWARCVFSLFLGGGWFLLEIHYSEVVCNKSRIGAGVLFDVWLHFIFCLDIYGATMSYWWIGTASSVRIYLFIYFFFFIFHWRLKGGGDSRRVILIVSSQHDRTLIVLVLQTQCVGVHCAVVTTSMLEVDFEVLLFFLLLIVKQATVMINNNSRLS